MLKLIQKIKTHTEAGSILEHMELFDRLEEYFKVEESCDNCIYWMDDMKLCINETVNDIFLNVDIKGNWCDQWRSEDEVVRNDDE